MQPYASIAIELSLGFLALFLYTKIMGKTSFSQLTPFDFISVLILGELLGNAVYDQEVDIWEILFATALWALLIYASMTLTQKLMHLRKTLEGEPSIIIRRGQIQYKVLQRNKMDLNQLQSMVRQQGYFSLKYVEFAILETNGALSVFPKSEYELPAKKELKLPLKPIELPITIILDGEVVKDNMRDAGLEEGWLQRELEQSGFRKPEQVLLAEWTQGQGLYVMGYDQGAAK